MIRILKITGIIFDRIASICMIISLLAGQFGTKRRVILRLIKTFNMNSYMYNVRLPNKGEE